MNGFPERFENEIRRLVEHSGKKEVNVSAALHRRHAAWIGGSMISSFSTFGDTTIKYQEYFETQPESEKSNCILKKSIY
jgi:actin-related protein